MSKYDPYQMKCVYQTKTAAEVFDDDSDE